MRCARSAICRALLAALALAGCGVVRPSGFAPICPSYEVKLRPLVEARCAQCHSAGRAEGGYRVGAHTQTVSRSEDGTPRVAPGDLASPFLAAARGTLGSHAAIDAQTVAVLEDWVVRCRAAPVPYAFHPRGWSTSTDPEQFHGQALRASRYDFAECRKCHGEDLRGGASKADCHDCHAEGPQACSTCHGDETSPAPPRAFSGARSTLSLGVGAHRAHGAFDCASCHRDAKAAVDERHYRRAGLFTTPVEVVLTANPAGNATWDRTRATCTNSYCHAPSNTDTAPTRFDPVWTRAGKGEVGCGSCHGFPPSSHRDNRCDVCHGPGYADGGVDPVLHVDGKVALRNGGVACDACHAGPDSPVFFDLRGQNVGAHDAHKNASRLRGPISCSECHLVPATVSAPGHLDSAAPAEVFGVDLGALAWKQGANPVFNAANGTCSSVYCHGGGEYGHPDTAPLLQRTPSWSGKADQVVCGACHGLPPQDGTLGHNAARTINCAVCHGGAVQADGGILFTALGDGGFTTKHLDGKLTGP